MSLAMTFQVAVDAASRASATRAAPARGAPTPAAAPLCRFGACSGRGSCACRTRRRRRAGRTGRRGRRARGRRPGAGSACTRGTRAWRARRAARRSSRCSARRRGSRPGYQLLRTSWSSQMRELRDLGVEAPHVLVEQVVAVVAAELVERLGDLALLRRHEVPPDATVVERHLGLRAGRRRRSCRRSGRRNRARPSASPRRCACRRSSVSMPQPWPTVSAVQASVTSRRGPRACGVVNVPATGSLETAGRSGPETSRGRRCAGPAGGR